MKVVDYSWMMSNLQVQHNNRLVLLRLWFVASPLVTVKLSTTRHELPVTPFTIVNWSIQHN